jgi:hypothetical protein
MDYYLYENKYEKELAAEVRKHNSAISFYRKIHPKALIGELYKVQLYLKTLRSIEDKNNFLHMRTDAWELKERLLLERLGRPKMGK